MNSQKDLNRIATLLTRFSTEVNIQNGNGEFGINIHAENVLIPILNIVLDCDLENINYMSGKNTPGIDLIDKTKGILVQVTSQDDAEKIEETLNKVNNYYNQYSIDQLYIFLLKARKGDHSRSQKIKDAIGNLDFSLTENVIDFSTLYTLICQKNDVHCTTEILNLLEDQFSDNDSTSRSTEFKYYALCKSIIEGNLIDDLFEEYDLVQMSSLCTDAAFEYNENISEYIRELLLKTVDMNSYKRYLHPSMEIMIKREELRRYFSEQLSSGLVEKFKENRSNS